MIKSIIFENYSYNVSLLYKMEFYYFESWNYMLHSVELLRFVIRGKFMRYIPELQFNKT